MYDIAANSSLVLCLASETSNGIDCIATVEVRLQPTDAKIPLSHHSHFVIAFHSSSFYPKPHRDPS